MEERGLKRGYSKKIQTAVVARRLSSSYSLHFEVQFFSMMVLDLDLPILLVPVVVLVLSDVLLTFQYNRAEGETVNVRWADLEDNLVCERKKLFQVVVLSFQCYKLF